MIKKIIGIFLLLHLSFLCSMEHTDTEIQNKLGETILDSELRKIKGGVTDDDIGQLKKDNMFGYYKSNEVKDPKKDKILLLKLTYFFKDYPQIHFFNKGLGHINIIDDLLKEDSHDNQQVFLKNLCLYTDYYFISDEKQGKLTYNIFYHKYAQFFMCIDNVSTRKNYIQKHKKILSLWQNDGPADNEIISQFMRPDDFLNNVINRVFNNKIAIKKAFFKTYLNDFLTSNIGLLGYCYFFNYLFEKIFENDSLQDLINPKNANIKSYSIIENKLTDPKDYLSLLLKGPSEDQITLLIKNMVQDTNLKDTITNILKGEDVFPKNNQIILTIARFCQQNPSLLANILNLFDTKDRTLIQDNVQNVIQQKAVSKEIEDEFNSYIQKQSVSTQKRYESVFNGQYDQDIQYDTVVIEFLNDGNWSSGACMYLIKKLHSNNVPVAEIIKNINCIFLTSVQLSIDEKQKFLKRLSRLIPSIYSFSYQKNNKTYFAVYESQNSDLYNKMSQEDKNVLLTCFAVPGIEYAVVLKAITDDTVLTSVKNALKNFSVEEKTLVLKEMARCFSEYQKVMFVFGYTRFFNLLINDENILDFLLRGGIIQTSKSQYKDIENGLNAGQLIDSLDPYSSSFNVQDFIIAVTGSEIDNPYKKAWSQLFLCNNQDLKKNILVTLINCITNKPQDSTFLNLTDKQINNIMEVLNSLIKYGNDAVITIKKQIIKEQNLPIEYKNNNFMRKPLTENEQFQSTYHITKEQAAKNINKFLEDNILTKKSLTDVDKNAIKWIVQTHVDQLNDDSFLQLINLDFLNDLYDTFFNDLQDKFFAIKVNKNKHLDYDDHNNRYILILNDFAPVYRKLTTNQRHILKKFNFFDSSTGTDEEYHTIYKKIINPDAFSKMLTGLQQTIIDRSSKTGTQQNNFNKDLCSDFLDIFLKKLYKYNEDKFVFGIYDFIFKVYEDYFNNIEVKTVIQHLDFVSTKTNLDLFLAEIQKSTQDHNFLKKAMVNGLSAYVRHVKEKDGYNILFSLDHDLKNNLIINLCTFLQYDIANINLFFKELKVNKQYQDLARAIFSVYQKNTSQKDSTLVLNENNDYYQISEPPKIEKNIDKKTKNEEIFSSESNINVLKEEPPVIPLSDNDNVDNSDQTLDSTNIPPDNKDPKTYVNKSGGQGVSFFGVLSTIGSILAWPFKTLFNFLTSFFN